jgi:antitoxin (DNA-binding transcriptional repressor) of toxin-antitoxin stability system
MKKVSATQLRGELYRILDHVLETGEEVLITRTKGSVVLRPAKSARVVRRKSRGNPKLVVGNPDDLVHFDWSKHWKPFL